MLFCAGADLSTGARTFDREARADRPQVPNGPDGKPDLSHENARDGGGRMTLRIFDCTTFLHPEPSGRVRVENGRKPYDAGHIPGAGLLDLQAELSDTASKLRFTMPEPQILAGIAAAEKREQELLTPSVLTELIAPGDDVAHRWDAAAVSTKREVARLLFSADVLGELRLSRAPVRGRRCPVEQRLHWWKP